MNSGVIDVWDERTFDSDLLLLLRQNENLIRKYLETEDRIVKEHDFRKGLDLGQRPSNPFAANYWEFADNELTPTMESRTIRAWHYTRLTDSEIDLLLAEGIHLSAPASFRARLDSQIACGNLTPDSAERILGASPFNDNEQSESRTNQFWMTSHPQPIEDGGVSPLLGLWGGEVTHFWLKDRRLRRHLATIGLPRVLEVAVPLAVTQKAHSAALSVISTLAVNFGCGSLELQSFDVLVTEALPSSTILRVHTLGDSSFQSIGISYPDGFAAYEQRSGLND